MFLRRLRSRSKGGVFPVEQLSLTRDLTRTGLVACHTVSISIMLCKGLVAGVKVVPVPGPPTQRLPRLPKPWELSD